MRKIAVIAMTLLALAAVGCSKKTEEQAPESTNETVTAPAAQQEMPAPAPAPMEQSGEQNDSTQENTQEGQPAKHAE